MIIEVTKGGRHDPSHFIYSIRSVGPTAIPFVDWSVAARESFLGESADQMDLFSIARVVCEHCFLVQLEDFESPAQSSPIRVLFVYPNVAQIKDYVEMVTNA